MEESTTGGRYRSRHGALIDAAFPVTQNEPIALGNLDMYTMDTYQPDQRWILIAGLRATWNTDPVNRHGFFARPAGSFLDMPHNIVQPLNQVTRRMCVPCFPPPRC
jgi:outer membrane receptor protein involved in Fe transport